METYVAKIDDFVHTQMPNDLTVTSPEYWSNCATYIVDFGNNLRNESYFYTINIKPKICCIFWDPNIAAYIGSHYMQFSHNICNMENTQYMHRGCTQYMLHERGIWGSCAVLLNAFVKIEYIHPLPLYIGSNPSFPT